MTLGFKSFNANILHEINNALKEALISDRSLIRLQIADINLDPEKRGDSSERRSFQAHLEKTPYPIVYIAPPSKMTRELGDWSSVEAIEKSHSVFKRCVIAYERAIAPYANEELAKKGALLISESLSKRFETALSIAQAPAQVASSDALHVYQGWRELLDNKPDLAEMSALRSALSRLDPADAMALMAQSDLLFGMSDELENALKAPVAQSTGAKPSSLLAGLKRDASPSPGRYQLVKNGSFVSSVTASANDAMDMARLILGGQVDLGMEHAVHQHFLKCPDGLLHGADRFEAWAKKTLRMAEVFEISKESAMGSAPVKALSL